jgi:hypothetical protein
MIYSQPVYYELGQLAMPVLLMIGDKDTTAIGKNLAPPDVFHAALLEGLRTPAGASPAASPAR